MSKEEYRRIVGDEQYEIDNKLRTEYDEFSLVVGIGTPNNSDAPWLIYPNDIMQLLGIGYGEKVTLEIRRVADARD